MTILGWKEAWYMGRSSFSQHLVEGFSQSWIMKEACWDKISLLVMARQC